nr:PREDICTED: serpin-ZX-like [Daucus carota subsp. sativus]
MAQQEQVDVSLNLSKHILLNYGKDSNLVFSPISIQVILGLVAAGSSGQTLDQLLSFLKARTIDELNYLYSSIVDRVFAKDSSSSGPCLSLANGVWLQKSLTLKPSFKEVVETVYKAACRQVDFESKEEDARNVVNSWAEKETKGLIKEILPSGSVDSSTKLVFANALYFKGAWSCEFDASRTKDNEFHLLDGSSIQVPFMTSNKKKQLIRVFNGFKVLGLPYKQGDKRQFSMYIFLPDAKNGLPRLVEKFGSVPGFLERHIPYKEVEVGAFRVPKFKFSFEFEASDVLKELGLVLPFTRNDDLTEMADSPVGPKLCVSRIFHKSFIEVNEQGTEAAAVASVSIVLLCRKFYIDFVADHPFLFVIRENNTGSVQFIGQVLNPSST